MAEGSLYRIELDITNLKRQVAEVSNAIHGIGKTAEQEGSKIDGVFKKVGGYIAGYFTAQQALAFARSIVQVRSEIESLEVSFRTLLGSEEKASALFGQIRQFAVNTPMMMNDLSKGAQMLLSFNYDADKVMPTLKALGDISMGDSQKFMSLTLAFSQMSSTGKLMGQDLLQMINAGFNPLAEISAKTGKSMRELKDEMAKGAISAQMVEEAFISATSEGGRFYGMLEAQSKTMKGAISNLQGAWEDMLNAIGEDTQEALTGAVAGLTDIIKNYEALGRVIAELIVTFGVYKAAVLTVTVVKSGLTAAEAAHYGWLVLTEKAQKLLNATILKNPYALAAAALVALAAAMYEVYKHQTKMSESMKAVDDEANKFAEATTKEQLSIDKLFIKLKNAKKGSEEYKKAKKDITDHYGQYLKGLSDEITSLNDLEGAYRAVSDAALDAAKKRSLAASTDAAADAYAKSTADISDEIYKLIQKRYSGKKTADGMDMVEERYARLMKVLREGGTPNGEWVKEFDRKQTTLGAADAYGNATLGQLVVNDMQDLIDQWNREKKSYNDAIANAKRRFGEEMPEEGTDKPGDTSTETQEEREKRLKELWNKNNEYEERLKKIEAYKQKIKNAQRDAEFEIAQTKIDAMDDGLAKTMAQNRLNYQKALADNVDTEKAMLEEYRDRMQTEWEAANPKFKEQNLQFDRLAIKELPADEIRILEQNSEIACNIYETANKKALDAALNDFKTYEQRRLEIETRYSALINSMYEEDGNGGRKLMEGVTQANIDNITRQMKAELAALADEMMKSSTEYVKFFTAGLTMTVDEVEKIGDAIKQNLNKQLEDGALTIDEYTRSWNEVEAVIENVRNQFSDYVTFTRSGIDGLIAKNKELAEAKKAAAMADYAEASKNGDTAAMDVAKAEMNAASTMISAASSATQIIAIIETIIESVNNAISGISDSIHALSDMVESFGVDTESTDSEWAQLTFVFDTMEESTKAISDSFKSFLSGDIFGGISGLIKSISIIIQRINEWHDRALNQSIEEQRKLIEDLDGQYQDLEETVAETFASSKRQSLEAQRELLNSMLIAAEAAKAFEEAKKNPDDEELKAWDEKIADYNDQLKNLQEDIEGFLFDSDILSEINSLGDALAEAFMKGEDAASIFASSAKDLVKQALRNIIKDYIQSADYIKQIEDRINAAYEDDGELTQSEIEGIISFTEQLGNDFQQKYGWIESALDKVGTGDVTATSKGITTASQESVDELNGRVTAIQGHTYELANNSRTLVSSVGNILRSVINIENHAGNISSRVAAMQADMLTMKQDVDYMRNYGVTIR